MLERLQGCTQHRRPSYTLILQMRSLRPREGKQLAYGHTACWQHILDGNPGSISGQVFLPCQTVCVLLSLALLASLVLRKVSKVIPASAVGGESPGLLTQRCLWLLTGRRGSGYCGRRRSLEASPGAAAGSAQLWGWPPAAVVILSNSCWRRKWLRKMWKWVAIARCVW